jgi:hypothetical protein
MQARTRRLGQKRKSNSSFSEMVIVKRYEKNLDFFFLFAPGKEKMF